MDFLCVSVLSFKKKELGGAALRGRACAWCECVRHAGGWVAYIALAKMCVYGLAPLCRLLLLLCISSILRSLPETLPLSSSATSTSSTIMLNTRRLITARFTQPPMSWCTRSCSGCSRAADLASASAAETATPASAAWWPPRFASASKA